MNERIKQIVNALYIKYGTCDPFSLADKLGIEIQYVPFGRNPLGQYAKILGEPSILINESVKGTERSFFVLAHEIFHFIEHEDLAGYYVLNAVTRGKLETEANLFATILLLNFFIEEQGAYPSSVKEMSYRFGIPDEITENYI